MLIDVPAQFSIDELLEALQTHDGDNGEGLSTAEIAERLGRSETWVRKRLRQLYLQGRLHCSRRTSEGLDGRIALIPVYSLKVSGGTDNGS